MSNGDIPSLTNPPNAPQKKRQRRQRLFEEEEERKPEWRVLMESGWVRPKFLRYTPEDVEEIEEYDTLMTLRDLYFPASQPQNLFEMTYCTLLREAIDAKLYVM